MNLYLVQHAQPKTKDEDPKRPLSDKGWTDIRKIAVFLAKHRQITVNQIMHSGKTRARQTAQILVEGLSFSQEIEEVAGLKPLDDPDLV